MRAYRVDDHEDGLSNFLRKMSRLRIVLQRLDELVECGDEQVEPTQVRLQVGPVLPQSQLELLVEVDALEDEVGQGLDGEKWPVVEDIQF